MPDNLPPDEELPESQLEAALPEDPVDWDLEERDAWLEANQRAEAPVYVVVDEDD